MYFKKVCFRLVISIIIVSLSVAFFGCGSSGGGSEDWIDNESVVRVSSLKGRVIAPINNNLNALRGSGSQPYFSLITTKGTKVFIEDDNSLWAVAESDSGDFVIPNVPEGKHRVIANIVSGTTTYRQRSDVINVTGQYEIQEMPYSVELSPALYYVKIYLSDLVTSSPVHGIVNIWGFDYETVNGVVEVGPFPGNNMSKEVKITANGYKDLHTLINFGEDYKSDTYIKMTPTTSTDSNQAPIVSIQQNLNDVIIKTNEEIGLSGVGIDPDGDKISYRWTADAGKFYNPNSQQTTFVTPSVTGAIRVTLTGTDSKGAVGQAVLNLNIQQGDSKEYNPQNQPPAKPITPFPENLAKDMGEELTLTWVCSDPNNDALTYTVNFGKQGSDLKIIAQNIKEPSLTIKDLEPNTTYFWQVTAYDEHYAKADSEKWQFSTGDFNNQPPYMPSFPEPSDNSKGVDEQYVAFSWSGGDPDGDSVTYSIYLATATSLVSSDITDFMLIQKTNILRFDYFGLAKDSTYQWKIVAMDNRGAQTEGPVWTFSTVEKQNTPPSYAILTEPSDGASEIGVDQKLRWTANDEDGDVLYYNVYFGTTTEPELVSSSQTSQIYDPVKLDNDTTYYWRIEVSDGKVTNERSDLWRFTTEKITDEKPVLSNIIAPKSTSDSLKLYFSEYINTTTANQAFKFTPNVLGEWSWSQGNTIAEFTPHNGWIPGSYNRFDLQANYLEDATGNKVEKTSVLKFDIPSTVAVPSGYHSVAFPMEVAANTSVNISVPNLAQGRNSYVVAISNGDATNSSLRASVLNDILEKDPTYRYRLDEAKYINIPIDMPNKNSSIRAAQKDKAVGDVRTFHISDDSGKYDISAKLMKLSSKTAIYVDQNISASESDKSAYATRVLNKFDNEILSKVRNAFGDEPPVGVDGDSRTSIVLLDITGSTIGYFWMVDLYTNPKNGNSNNDFNCSNEGKILYMDYNIESDSTLYGCIAHEFQHMINYYQKNKTLNYNQTKVNEDTWINEGLSKYSEEICGYSLPQGDWNTTALVRDSMNNNKSLSITEWERSPNTSYNYGQVYLFMHFFAYPGRYNSDSLNVTRQLVNGNGKALTGEDNIREVSQEPFKETIAKYALSLFINDYQSDNPSAYSINKINLVGNYNCNNGTKVKLPGYTIEDATNPVSLRDMPFDNSIRFFKKTSTGSGDTVISITTGGQPVTLYLLDERD